MDWQDNETYAVVMIFDARKEILSPKYSSPKVRTTMFYISISRPEVMMITWDTSLVIKYEINKDVLETAIFPVLGLKVFISRVSREQVRQL